MDFFEKKYYRIADVAEYLGLPQSTLRYWEKVFPECAPKRNSHNVRYYTPRDVETLKIIRFLVKEKGLKLNAARKQLKSNIKNTGSRMEIIERLENVKENLTNLLSALNKRGQAIDINDHEE